MRIGFLILSLFVFSAQTQAQITLNLTYFDAPPFEFQENNEAKGINVDVVREVCKKINAVCQLNFFPFKRAKQSVLDFRKTKQDGIFMFYKNPEREKSYAYTDVLSEHKVVFFKREGSDFDYKGSFLDGSIKNYKIGRLTGYYVNEEFSQALEQNLVNMRTNAYHEDGFKRLLGGSIDAYLVGEAIGRWVLRGLSDEIEKSNTKLATASQPVKVGIAYMAFAKDNQKALALIPQINEALSEIRNSSQYEEIVNQYLGN